MIANADGCNSVDEVFASVSPDGNNGSDSFKVTLEEPAAGLVHMGVGNLRGWAVSSAGIRKVDGFPGWRSSLARFPYGGTRTDVGVAFPDIVDGSDQSVGMSFNYSGLSAGRHTIEAQLIALITRQRRTVLSPKPFALTKSSLGRVK